MMPLAADGEEGLGQRTERKRLRWGCWELHRLTMIPPGEQTVKICM